MVIAVILQLNNFDWAGAEPMDNRQSMMIPTASGGGAPACDNSGGGAGALRSSGGANNAARGNNNNNNRQYSNRGNAGQRYQSRNFKRESRSITQNIKDTIESGRYFANNTGPRSLLLDAQLPKTKKKMAVGNVSIKERFVQANCQFLLAKEAADFDAQAYAQDPDLPVNWDNVEEVGRVCVYISILFTVAVFAQQLFVYICCKQLVLFVD